MRSISGFQRLPLHIAECIAQIYVHRDDMMYIGRTNIENESQRDKWFELYNVSYSWRVLALYRLCGEVDLKISTTKEIESFTFTHSQSRLAHSVKNYSYVNSANIILHNVTASLSGQMYRSFSMAWPKVVVFPSARFLSICIEGNVDQPAVEGIAIKSELFNWVAQRIPSSFPKLLEARIKHRFGDYGRDPQLALRTEQHANNLFMAILDRVEKVDIYASPVCLVPNDMYFQNGSKLTHLNYNCICNMEFFHLIVKRSAPTLLDLALQRFRTIHTRLLIFSHDNVPIVYPRLKILYVNEGMDSITKKLTLDKSVVPFPALRILCWSARYAFGDDTLFRGNFSNLEYLSIVIDSDILDALQNDNLYASRGYPNLKLFTAISPRSIFSRIGTPHTSTAFTAALISPRTEQFVTDIRYSYPDILHILSSCLYGGNMACLHLSRVALALREIVQIIANLPNMETFVVQFGGIDAEFDGLKDKAITDQLYARHYPLTHSLKRWGMIATNAAPIPPVVTSIIALAILCPSLTHVAISKLNIESVRGNIRAIIESGTYDEHAERILKLRVNTSFRP